MANNVNDYIEENEEKYDGDLSIAKNNHLPDHVLTKEKVKKLLGKQCNAKVTDSVMELLNNIEKDTDLDQALMEDRIVSNINVLEGTKGSMPEYINAMKYCTLKQNMSNIKAYTIVFPDRVQAHEETKIRREAEGNPLKVSLESKVSNYNRGPLIVKIDTQLAIEFSVLYATQRHRALKVLIDLSQGNSALSASGEKMTVTPMVQMQAASKIMEELKPSEENKLSIDINVKDDSLDLLKDSLADIAKVQMGHLKAGNVGLLDLGALKVKEKEEIIDV